MKMFLIAAAALLIGLVVGTVGTVAQFSDSSEIESLPSRDPALAKVHGKGPKVKIVNGEYFNFGSMEKDSESSHVFVIRNSGDSVLTLEKGDTTCKCTLSDLKTTSLAPGESSEITLSWTPKSYSSAFKQTAKIHTNDPNRRLLELVVEGYVREAVRAVPAELALGDVPSNSGRSGKVKVFGYVDKPVKITSLTLSDMDEPELYELTQSPLSEEDIAAENGATSGALVQLVVKPGLPLGAISQTIQITTNLTPDHQFDVPVVGTVISDISWLPTDVAFRRDKNLLNWGVVDATKGAETKLYLLIKGELREEVEFTIGEIHPAKALQVELGEPQPAGGGKSILYPVTLRVKPGSRPMSLLGRTPDKMAKVTIESTHPDAKEIPLFIWLSIEE